MIYRFINPIKKPHKKVNNIIWYLWYNALLLKIAFYKNRLLQLHMKRERLILLCLLLIPVAVFAEENTLINGIYFKLIKKAKTAEVSYKSSTDHSYYTSYENDYSGDIVIPSQVEYDGVTYDVETIGEYAFYNCSINSITIPSSIKKMNQFSFWRQDDLKAVYIEDLEAWCNIDIATTTDNPLSYAHHLYLNGEEITDLIIPVGVKKIKYNSFYGGSSFTSLTIPETVEVIDGYSFAQCNNLKKVIIPNNVIEIGPGAFQNCSILSDITIGNAVTVIGKGAFSSCDSLKTIFLPNVTIIEEGLFSGCDSINTIVLGNGVNKISQKAFYNLPSLKHIILGDSITEIGDNAFQSCTGLDSVIITNNVIKLGESCFSGCSELKDVILGDEVTSIGKNAFSNCTKLSTITIGKKVNKFDENAFYNCRNLSRVNISDLEAWCNIATFSKSTNNPLTYAHHLYLNGEEIIDLVIPETISIIQQYAFTGCNALKSVTIHPNINRIKQYAFDRCDSLEGVYIKDLEAWCGIFFEPYIYGNGTDLRQSNPLQYAHHLFLDSAEVKKVVYPEDGYIHDFAFLSCWSIDSVIIDPTITAIGKYSFYNCKSLSTIAIPESVTSIGCNAFEACEKLETIYIYGKPHFNGNDVFANCEELKDLYCYAQECPTAGSIFNNSLVEYATLHVPEQSIELYKSKYPWKEFGTIVALTEEELSTPSIKVDNDEIIDIFTITGQKISNMQSGLNIIHTKNGKNYIIYQKD